MRSISLDCFDQVGDEVESLLELNIDICEGVLSIYPQSDKRIVEHDSV